MTTAGRDPFPRLADALTDVSARLQEISTELRALQTGPQPAATPAPTPTPPPAHQPPPQPAWYPYPPAPYGPPPYPMHPQQPPQPRPQQPAPAPRRPVAPPSEPVPTLWERLGREGAGSRFLAWVGGGVTLAGVVLLLVLAIQRGYIGPLPRVLLGVVLGGALTGIGLRLNRNPDNRVGAHALAATGVAVLYLDVVAATSLYHFLPAAAGLAVGLVIAVGGIVVATRWDSQLFAMFVVLGCAASAPVLTSGVDALLVGFLLVLQIATGPAQLRRSWSGLTIAAAVPPIAAVLLDVQFAAHQHDRNGLVVALLCALVTAVQVVLAGWTAMRKDDPAALGLLLAAPVPTLLSAVVAPHYWAIGLVGALSVVLLVLWALTRFDVVHLPVRSVEAIGLGGVAALFETLCLAFGANTRAIALLLAAALLAAVAARLRYAAALVAAALFAGVGSLLALVGPLPLQVLAMSPARRLPAQLVATAGTTGAAVALAAIAVAAAAGRVRPAIAPELGRATWIVGGIAALYGASGAMLSIGLAVSPDEQGFRAGHVLVTVSWTVGALVLLLLRARTDTLRVAGLALVAAALAKLVLFDLASLNGIPRVLAFLGAGLVLLGAGARYAKQVSTTRTS